MFCPFGEIELPPSTKDCVWKLDGLHAGQLRGGGHLQGLRVAEVELVCREGVRSALRGEVLSVEHICCTLSVRPLSVSALGVGYARSLLVLCERPPVPLGHVVGRDSVDLCGFKFVVGRSFVLLAVEPHGLFARSLHGERHGGIFCPTCGVRIPLVAIPFGALRVGKRLVGGHLYRSSVFICLVLLAAKVQSVVTVAILVGVAAVAGLLSLLDVPRCLVLVKLVLLVLLLFAYTTDTSASESSKPCPSRCAL